MRIACFLVIISLTAAGVRAYDTSPLTGPQITDATTAAVSDLFNVVYDLLLQLLARFFAFGHETEEQSGLLADVSVQLMSGVTRPLGLLLAGLPVGPNLPGATAGASFQLAYRSNFLLPHRRVAWIRFAERLEEAADLAARIPLPGLTRVEHTLRDALIRMSAHIEAV